jgi:hypothetical protein
MAASAVNRWPGRRSIFKMVPSAGARISTLFRSLDGFVCFAASRFQLRLLDLDADAGFGCGGFKARDFGG